MAMTKITLDEVAACISPISLTDLAVVPHILFEASSTAVKHCLQIFEEPGGVFGMPMFFDSSSRPYLEPEDSRILEDFSLWRNEASQKMISELAAIGKPGCFTMVIPADTSLDVLRQLYAGADSGIGYYSWDRSIPLVLELRQNLGWCYVPLPDECGLACVVVADKNIRQLNQLKHLLATANRTFCVIGNDTILRTVKLRCNDAF